MTDAFQALRARFRVRAAQELTQLEALTAAGPDSAELRRLVHNIAGAAGTFGFPVLSEAAIAIDDCYAAGTPPPPETFRTLAQALSDAAAGG